MTKPQTKGDKHIACVELYQERMKVFEKLAKRNGFEVSVQNMPLISFSKVQDETIMTLTIDVDKYSMISMLEHPKKGVTKLKRENLTMSLVKGLIENPRRHTPPKVKTTYL